MWILDRVTTSHYPQSLQYVDTGSACAGSAAIGRDQSVNVALDNEWTVL
jgi:hypothetical protein